MTPALAGGFLTTAPSGKSPKSNIKKLCYYFYDIIKKYSPNHLIIEPSTVTVFVCFCIYKPVDA